MKPAPFALIPLFAATPALAVPPPDAIRAMIDTAIGTNDPATVSAVVAVAKRTAPDSAAEIDAIVAGYNDQVAARKADDERAARERLATASLLSLWKGEIELGGSWSTGNTRTLGLYGSTKLRREGLNWQHDLTARVDYQETDHDPTTERAIAAYQPRYKISRSFYAYGLAQYEHDRFLGYRSRLTAGTGLGVIAASRPNFSLEFDLGPAFRYTDYYELDREDRVAGRGALKMKWAPWPTLTVSQEAAVYVEKGNTTATSTTAVDTRLWGPLKARLSYNVQYERDAPVGQKSVDTVSRASLVYGF